MRPGFQEPTGELGTESRIKRSGFSIPVFRESHYPDSKAYRDETWFTAAPCIDNKQGQRIKFPS